MIDTTTLFGIASYDYRGNNMSVCQRHRSQVKYTHICLNVNI